MKQLFKNTKRAKRNKERLGTNLFLAYAVSLVDMKYDF